MMIFDATKTQNIPRTLLFAFLACIFLSLLLLSGCGYLEDTESRRKELAKNPDQPITFGVAWPFSAVDSKFQEGVELAVDRINKNGGVDGRKIKIIYKDDQRDVTRGRFIAQQYADNPEVFAVIGHYNSYVSLPASTIYQLNGLLMLTPGSSSPEITSRGYDLVFSSIANDNRNGDLLARYMQNQGYKELGILYEESRYGRGLANSIQTRARELGLAVGDRYSYSPGEVGDDFFVQVIEHWKRYEVDAVAFPGGTEEAVKFIKLARQKDLNLPLVAGDGLDAARLWAEAGTAANNTVLLEPYHVNLKTKQSEQFVRRFRDCYGGNPDAWAAQGYDAVNLLAEAVRRAKNPLPEKLASELRQLENWSGVTGKYNFDDNGALVGNPLELLRLKDGKLVPVEMESEEVTE